MKSGFNHVTIYTDLDASEKSGDQDITNSFNIDILHSNKPLMAEIIFRDGSSMTVCMNRSHLFTRLIVFSTHVILSSEETFFIAIVSTAPYDSVHITFEATL